MKTGKLESSLKIESHHLTGNIRKLKLINQNKIALLMDNYDIGLFEIINFKFEFLSIIKFGHTTDESSNFIFLQEPNNELFRVFDLINCKKHEIKFDTKNLSILEIKSEKLLDTPGMSDSFVCYLQNLDCVIIIDKFFGFFLLDQKQNKIRYSNVKNEKLIKKFKNLYANAKNFKYKILYEEVNCLVVSVCVLNDQKLLGSVVIHFKIISAKHRTGTSVELEVLNVFLGNKYQLVKNQSLYLCIYTGYEVEKNFLLDPEQFELENKYQDKRILIHDLLNDKIITEFILKSIINNLCIDQKLTYLAFTDEAKNLTLIKIKDSELMGSLKLYGEDSSIKFSPDNHFISLSLYDRRLFSLLVVQKDVPSQELTMIRKNQIESNSKENENNRATEMVQSLVDSSDSEVESMDSTSDETGTDDEVDSVEIRKKNRKKSSTKIHEVKVDDPSNYFNFLL